MLPHKWPNNVRLTKLENIRKLSKPHRMIAWYPAFRPKSKFLNTK